MKIVRFCVPGFSYEAIGYLEGETVIDFSRGMRAFRATFPQRHRASSSEFFSIQAMLSEESPRSFSGMSGSTSPITGWRRI